MLNVNQLTSQLAKMPDPMLQKYAAMHKNDPYTVSLALAESNRRKAMRVGAAPMPGEQPKVVDQGIAEIAAPTQQIPQQMAQQQLPENTGIGQIPAPNMQGMADGGIVGFAGDQGSVTRMTGSDLFDKALDKEGITDPLRRAFAKAIHGQESSGRINAPTSNRGAGGPMQVRSGAWKDVSSPDMDPKNPFDNMRVGIRYAMKGFNAAGGDPVLAGAHYYGGPGGMKKLMEGKAVSDPENPNAPTTAGYGASVAKRMTAFLPVGSAEAANIEKSIASIPTPKAVASAPVATKPAASAPGTDNRAWYDRYRDLAMSGDAQKAMLQGVQDVPSSLVGAPVDLSYYIANKLGRKPIEGEKPIMGSKYIQEKLEQLGVREPDSANPDLQNIREATSGIAGLYNPLSKTKAVETAAQAVARRARENAPKQLGGPTVTTATETAPKQLSGPTVTPAREAELVKAAEAEANAARVAREAELVKAAQAEANATRFTPYAEGPKAPQVGRIAAAQDVAGDLTARTRLANINPLGVVAAAPVVEQGINALTAPNKGLPMDDLGYDRSGLDALTPKGDVEDLMKGAAKDAGMKPSKFKDEMALQFFLGLMGGQSPNALTNVSQAGLGALKFGQELKKDESEQMYREALSKHYGVDPMIQRAQALQDPAIARQFAKMKELEREPVTKEALLKAFMGSPEGMAASSDPAKFRTAFQNYIQSYESVLGPIGGMPPGVRVTRSGS